MYLRQSNRLAFWFSPPRLTLKNRPAECPESYRPHQNSINTRELVALAVEKGLWQPSGAKTPEQTLYSAIFRENATKENPRIVKSDKKGKFIYTGK